MEHGAKRDILTDSHPHIGSNKLPKLVSAIRETIESHGGEVHFNHKLTDFEKTSEGMLMKFSVNHDSLADDVKPKHDCFLAKAMILATGHSARDIYELVHSKGLQMIAKDFALGVRIEHPQKAIDRIQYGKKININLPAARYSLSCRIRDRSVYSFCMCPGGLIVPTATAPGELVINGMSLSRRDSAFANSGMVVEIPVNQLPESCGQDALRTMRYQSQIERNIFNLGSGDQKAPAQRMSDFINGKMSSQLSACSYIPGIYSSPLHDVLPEEVSGRLSEAFGYFSRKMNGFMHEDAQLLAVESRTSAPVRIPRDEQSLMHSEMEGLFPCGEGAGYAGGIMSAALDGMRVVDKIAEFFGDS